MAYIFLFTVKYDFNEGLWCTTTNQLALYRKHKNSNKTVMSEPDHCFAKQFGSILISLQSGLPPIELDFCCRNSTGPIREHKEKL